MIRDRGPIRIHVLKIASSVMVLMAVGLLAGCSTQSKMPEADKANFKGSRPPDNFTPRAPTRGPQSPGN